MGNKAREVKRPSEELSTFSSPLRSTTVPPACSTSMNVANGTESAVATFQSRAIVAAR
jgi:hypothetical protein